MQNYLTTVEPIDYLIIGHVTQDLTPNGAVLGGTVSYASLTARALGMRVGIVTACREDFQMPELEGIPIIAAPSEYTTTFENIYTPNNGRIQYLRNQAAKLHLEMVPPLWRKAPVVHLGALDWEIGEDLLNSFPNALLGLTLQGWLRDWDHTGRVRFRPLKEKEAAELLQNASAAVLSIEDVQGDESMIEELHSVARILVVTEGAAGARLYWNGDGRRFRPPYREEVDPTGAGDIFAAAFFCRLYTTNDPWEAARFATKLASFSVLRRGLQGVPTPEEIKESLFEVIEKV
jgi:sugar/nucleoside kinase (ribokinase family)